MIKVKKKKDKVKRKRVGNVRTTEKTRKKGGNVSQVVNVYVTKGGGGRRKAPAPSRPSFLQSQPQLFTANYDNTLLNQIQPIQDKYLKIINTNNDLLNKLLIKQRTADSSIQTDTLTNDKLFTKETQTAPEKIPSFRPADTQTEPIQFSNIDTQTEPIQFSNIDTQTDPIQFSEVDTQVTEEELEQRRDDEREEEEFLRGSGGGEEDIEEELESLVRRDIQDQQPQQDDQPQQDNQQAEQDELTTRLIDLKQRAKANDIPLKRGGIPTTEEGKRKQIRYYSEQIALKNRGTSI